MLDTKTFRTIGNVDRKKTTGFCRGFVNFITVFLLLVAVTTLYGQETLGELSTQMEIQGELQNQGQGSNRNPAAPKNTNQAAAAPVVLKTTPQAFANDVEPSLGEITVTFDQPMMDGNWSWTGGGETFPKTTGQPSYNQDKTICKISISLEPGKVYMVGINSLNARNFKNTKGIPAKRYVILFATKDADGKPTPIPDDMLKEARAINAQNNMSGTETSATKPEQLTNSESLPKDTNTPDIKDFNAFQRELNRINIETKGEEEQWLGPLDKKPELARSIDELVVAQLRFIRKLAESEHSEQTIKAIDLVIRQRQERLNKLITKLEDETRQERQQQAPERRERRTMTRTGSEQGTQTDRTRERPPRRTRDANMPGY